MGSEIGMKRQQRAPANEIEVMQVRYDDMLENYFGFVRNFVDTSSHIHAALFASQFLDAVTEYDFLRSFLEMEEYNNAILPYKKAIELDTTKNVWMYELGLIYYNQNQFSNALTYFNMALNAGYPKSNDYYENIGFAYLSTGDVENGMKNLSIVLARKPNNKELIGDIAQSLYYAKRYDDALQYYQKLMEINSNDARALYMAGIIFQKKGQKEKGQAMCDKAIGIDPSLAEKRQKKGEPFGL